MKFRFNQWLRNFVIIDLGLLLLCACNWSMRSHKEDAISRLMGSEIRFERLLSFNLSEGMSLSSLLEKSNNSIVIYVDSSSCEDCSISYALNIRGYEFELKQKHREDIQFIYIFNTQDIGALQKRLHDFGFYRHYFVDFENTFLSNNQIPKDKRFHTFLLKDKKVRIIGNPSTNQKIRNLFDKVLKLPPAMHYR